MNNDLLGQTYKRNYEGDYRCDASEVKAMLRDQSDESMDSTVLEDGSLDELCEDSIAGYRNARETKFRSRPFEELRNGEYLRTIGAAGISRGDSQLRPTVAGMLMFGYEHRIVRHFPNYFLDYQETLDPTSRWSDRVVSSSGNWSGNVFDFYYRALNKARFVLKTPFRLIDGIRIDEPLGDKALREALANCLTNADFYSSRGVVVRCDGTRISFENPGGIRVGLEQALRGGESDSRNKGLMKMFSLIGIGERAGSGIPTIFQNWREAGYDEPIIEELRSPDRVRVVLPLTRGNYESPSDIKRSIKSGDRNGTAANKEERERRVVDYLRKEGEAKTADVAKALGLSPVRTRAILAAMRQVEKRGGNRDRTYRLKANYR